MDRQRSSFLRAVAVTVAALVLVGLAPAAAGAGAPSGVTAATLTAPVPAITGTPQVGQTLTAVPGPWGPAPVALTYQWLAGGQAVSGATATTWKPTVAQLGTTVTVRVTGRKTGYTTVSRTSAATAAVLGALTGTKPTIQGTARTGSMLTAVPGAWGPAPVTLAYQWFGNGVAIDGATATTFTVGATEYGTTLKVRVSATKPGYAPLSSTSAATAAVSGPPVVHVSGTLSGPTVWSPTTASVYVVDAPLLISATGSLTVRAGTVVKLAANSGLTVRGGRLSIDGAVGSRTVLTSLADDTVASDTNGDGGATSPSAGSWGLWATDATNARPSVSVTRAELRHGQGVLAENDVTVRVQSSKVTGAITAARGWSEDSAQTAVTITDNTVTGGPIVVTSTNVHSARQPIAVLRNAVSGSTADNQPIRVDDAALQPSALAGNTTTGNLVGGIEVSGALAESLSWPGSGAQPPWVVGGFGLRVPSGVTMTLPAGGVLKAEEGAALTVAGTLRATGTASSPVTLTAYRDDSVGGDTNADGAASSPVVSWRGVVDAGGAVTLTSTTVKFAAPDAPLRPSTFRDPGAGTRAFTPLFTTTYTGISSFAVDERSNVFYGGSPEALTKYDFATGSTATILPPGAGGAHVSVFPDVITFLGGPGIVQQRGPDKVVRTLGDFSDFLRATQPTAGFSYGFQGIPAECVAQAPGVLSPYTRESSSHVAATATTADGVYVLDSGAQSVLRMDAAGDTSLVATIPPRELSYSPNVFDGSGDIPCAQGYTYHAWNSLEDLAVGPGGYLYVTTTDGNEWLSPSDLLLRIHPVTGEIVTMRTDLGVPLCVTVAPDATVYTCKRFGAAVDVNRPGAVYRQLMQAHVPVGADWNAGRLFVGLAGWSGEDPSISWVRP
ncbi:hypothetical protein [uncultured Cellulomonas sp.]|uniref:hypothetical protein n=1 Tax=uncultured Cellulomonas sp. TaxID=189682 RepID=UPI0028E7E8AE|nr:hypothetical protein [uncultured Cellulomonas sp.]